MTKTRALVFALSLGLVSCRTTPQHSAPGQTTKAQNDKVRALTLKGSNSQGRFTPDGQGIVFVSEKRPNHTHPQIYYMDLKSGREKRITYQDGINLTPIVNAHDHRLYYVSSTDEGKENSRYIHRVLAELSGQATSTVIDNVASPGTEIYSSTLQGQDIQRLTRRPGFDGSPSFSPNGKEMFFNSLIDERMALFKMAPGDKTARVLVKDDSHNEQPALSPAGTELAWIRRANDSKDSHVVIGNAQGKSWTRVTPEQGIYRHASFSPDGTKIVFSSNAKGDFDIYRANKDGSCLERLTQQAGEDSYPQFSPDGRQIMFTRTIEASSQIYVIDLPGAPSCTTAQAQNAQPQEKRL